MGWANGRHTEGSRCGIVMVSVRGTEVHGGGAGCGQHQGLVPDLHQHWLGARVVVEGGEDELGDVGGGRVQVVDKGDEGALGGGHGGQGERGDHRGGRDDGGVDRSLRRGVMDMVDGLDGVLDMVDGLSRLVDRGQCPDIPGGWVTGPDGLHGDQGREVLTDGVLQRLDPLVMLEHFYGGRVDQGIGCWLETHQ